MFLKYGNYARTVVNQYEGGRSLTLVDSLESTNTTSSSKGDSYEVYATIESAADEIYNKVPYTTIKEAQDISAVYYANVSKTLAQGGNLSKEMTFNWSGKEGQPKWLWGW